LYFLPAIDMQGIQCMVLCKPVKVFTNKSAKKLKNCKPCHR